MTAHIPLPMPQLRAFCTRYGVKRMALFGSVLREDFTAESDIDVLVEFEPDRIPDLLRFAAMEEELTLLLGRQVDLNTPNFLSRHFRQKVLDTAQVIYRHLS